MVLDQTLYVESKKSRAICLDTFLDAVNPTILAEVLLTPVYRWEMRESSVTARKKMRSEIVTDDAPGAVNQSIVSRSTRVLLTSHTRAPKLHILAFPQLFESPFY